MNLYTSVLILSALTASSSVSAFSFVKQVEHAKRNFGHGRNVPSTTKLFGILDEVRGDNFVLGQDDEEAGISKQMEMAYESFLAELVFSPNDPRLDIIDNYERTCDPEWLAWLDDKVANSADPEEKMALRDLRGMIEDVMQKVKLSKMAEEREAKEKAEAEKARMAAAEAAAEEGRSLSNADLLQRANKVNTAGVDQQLDEQKTEQKVSFLDSELTPEIRMSYQSLVQELLPPYRPGETAKSVVYTNYDKFDAQLIKVLTELIENGDNDAKLVSEELAIEQQKRLAAATENLKVVLSAGDPPRMEGAIVRLGKEGKIDEPFLLLLEANANQARAAGASGPADLMMRLKKKAVDEKDKTSSTKEVKLLRKLLREESSEEREKLLEDAFTPRQNLLVRIIIRNLLNIDKLFILVF